MPRKKLSEPSVKVTLNMFERDWRRLQELYPSVGASEATRQIVKAHVARVEAKIARARETLVPEFDVELNEEGEDPLNVEHR